MMKAFEKTREEAETFLKQAILPLEVSKEGAGFFENLKADTTLPE